MEVSMPDNTLFRKVLFGGYHKGDVLSYIENLEAEKESLKFSLQEAETKEPELPPELKAEYESTIAQLQELKWWDWNIDKIAQYLPHIMNGNTEELMK